MHTFHRITFVLSVVALSACASSEIEPLGVNSRDGTDIGAPENSSQADGGDNTGDDAGGLSDGGATDTGDSGSSDMASISDASDAGEVDMFVMTDPCAADPGTPGWNALGGPISALPGVSEGMIPSVAIDDECRPIVAFHEDTETTEENIFVYRWNGTTWDPLGGALDATNQDNRWTTGVQIATDGPDIYLAWAEITPSNGTGVFVATWTGTDWQILGNVPSSGILLSFTMGLTIDGMGRPVVAWNERTDLNAPTTILAYRYENNVWNQLGTGQRTSTNNASALAPDVEYTTTGELILAWQEASQIHARRYNGTAWEDWGNTPFDAVADPSGAFDVNLASAPNGDVVVGWREAGDSTDVYVQRWDGTMWSILADGVDTADETQGRTNTGNLDLAVDGMGRTIFVFDEPLVDFGGTTRVHVWQHSNQGLAPLDGGVLDVNAGDTSGRSASVAIDQEDRVIVAFEEEGATAREIHVWRHQP